GDGGTLGERYVAGLPRPDRKRQSRDAGPHRRRLVGQHPKSKAPRAAQFGSQLARALDRPHESVVLADRLRVWRVVHDQGTETEPREQLEAALTRDAAISQRLRLELNRHVGPDARQFAALPRILSVSEQAFSIALVRHLGGVRQERVERSVAGDQVASALLADARYSFDVVD